MTKKVHEQNFISLSFFFSLWEILTKNLVTLKRWVVVKDEKF